MLTVQNFIQYYLKQFETEKLSVDPKDHGNFYNNKLVGSKWGVTGAALARYTGKDVTLDQMSNLSLEDASKIALRFYYTEPHIDILPWNTITASLLDFGWGSGCVTAIKKFQQLIATPSDGKIGQNTLIKFKEKLSSMGEEPLSNAFYELRKQFLISLNQPRFIKGWLNRLDAMKFSSPIWG